jgi:chaperonin GroES
MKIKPLHDRIIVKAAEKEQQTASGIILPDSAQEKPLKGEVVAVGPGKVLDNGKVAAVEVKVKDVILYGKYAGTEVKVSDEDLVILRQDDVLAIISSSGDTKSKSSGGKGKK